MSKSFKQSEVLASYMVNGTSVSVVTQYHDDIVKQCRAWAGKFVGGAWVLPITRLAAVQEEIGKDLNDTVEVEVGTDQLEGYQQLRLGWYVIASRRGRDDRANIYADLVEGTIPSSGGSVKNPAVNPSSDARFRLHVVRDFAVANKLSILGPIATVDSHAELAAERAKLVARIAEIDALLSE